MKNQAEEYDYIAREIFLPLFPVIAKRAVELLGKTSGDCLDVGSGGGMFGYHIAKITDINITFLDISPDAIVICKQRGVEWGFSERINTLVTPVADINLPNDSFDLIVSRGSISFWGGREEIRTVFRGLYRLLKPGGTILLGHSLGTPEIEAGIIAKMKVHNPDWPGCVAKRSNGLNNQDYAEIAKEIGINAKSITEPDGRWVFMTK